MAAAKPRVVALLLIANTNRPVSVEMLVDEVWPARPPASAVSNIRTYLHQLRRLMPGRISAGPAGYRFAAGAGTVDLAEFAKLTAAGRADAHGRPQAAATALREALGLWRGRPFEGEPVGPALQARAVAEQDEYLGAIELYGELLLRVGDAAAAQSLLRDAVRDHPLRERLRTLLLLAVYRSGDPAGALAGYEDARTTLAAELGIDPGPEPVMLHRAVLRRDDRLMITDSDGGLRAVVPFQAPPTVADFVGRDDEVARLVAVLTQKDAGAIGSCATAVVGGMAGVGKTTLAARVAYEIADAFPDGCLYADLRQPDGAAVPSGRILGRFLRALRVPGESVPADTAERAALFRSVLAERRVLVLADNAADEDQVRPLTPAAGGALLVTSRRLLTLPGAALVDLPPLSTETGVTLLARVAGQVSVAAEPDAAAELVRLCGGLPLGIRAIGIRLATGTGPSLAAAVARLTDERRRLDHLSVGDIDIRASLAISYRRLRPDALALLRTMSVVPARTFAPWLPAALLGIDEPQALALAELLCDAQVLVRTGEGRFGLHDLVRISAAEHAPAAPLIEAARLLLEAALTANLRLPARPMPLPHPQTPVPAAAATPVEWFESEIDGIRTLIPALVARGQADLAARLAVATANFCVLGARTDEWAATHEAVPADAALSAPTSAALALSIGSLHRFRDDNEGALPYLRRSYREFRRLGDVAGMAVAALGWCVAELLLGRLRVARAAYRRAQQLAPRLAGTPVAGYIHLTGRMPLSETPDDELAAMSAALEIFEATRETWGRAEAQTFLAHTYRLRRRLALEAEHARSAVIGYTQLRDEMQLTVHGERPDAKPHCRPAVRR